MTALWVEKYRPQTLEDYVWRDPQQRQKVEEWLASGALPHLLFSGRPGCGKTSLAELLIKLLGIPSGDVKKINASRERRLDVVDTIINFGSTWALNDTGIKYVILDEADYLAPLTQGALRETMERYSDNVRLILTANHPERLIDAIHSRCQGFQFTVLDENQFVERILTILDQEGIQYEPEHVVTFVDLTYPDMRKCINLMQQNCIAGTLRPPAVADCDGVQDYLLEVVALFRAGRFLEARKMLVAKAQTEEYVDIYRYFYRNLDLWGSEPNTQDEALLIIRKALVNHALVADQEINLSACLVELSRLAA